MFLPRILRACIPKSASLVMSLSLPFTSFPCRPLLYISPPLWSLSSHLHSVYTIQRVDRKTLGNLLLSQTFISYSSYINLQLTLSLSRDLQTDSSSQNTFILFLNKCAFPKPRSGTSNKGTLKYYLFSFLPSLPPSRSHTFRCFVGPSIV